MGQPGPALWDPVSCVYRMRPPERLNDSHDFNRLNVNGLNFLSC